MRGRARNTRTPRPSRGWSRAKQRRARTKPAKAPGSPPCREAETNTFEKMPGSYGSSFNRGRPASADTMAQINVPAISFVMKGDRQVSLMGAVPAPRAISWCALFVLPLLAAFLLVQGASASTVLVGTNLTDDASAHTWTTVQKGVTDGAPGDTVYVYNGTYVESIVVMNSSIALVGEARSSV